MRNVSIYIQRLILWFIGQLKCKKKKKKNDLEFKLKSRESNMAAPCFCVERHCVAVVIYNASEYWRNKINLSNCGTRQCHFLKELRS